MVAGNDLVAARVCTTYEIYAANFLEHSIVNALSFFIGESITQRLRSTLKLTCYNTVGGWCGLLVTDLRQLACQMPMELMTSSLFICFRDALA
jgi:hypothetical protein